MYTPIELSEVVEEEDIIDITKDFWENEIANPLKAGELIDDDYAISTSKRRKRFNLPVGKIRLHGSTAYDKHNFRMLDNVEYKANGFNGEIIFKDSESSTIWSYHVDRWPDNIKWNYGL